MMDINDRLEEHRSLIALSAALSVGRQLRLAQGGDTEPPAPQSTGRSRMAAVVARRAANWTKDRTND